MSLHTKCKAPGGAISGNVGEDPSLVTKNNSGGADVWKNIVMGNGLIFLDYPDKPLSYRSRSDVLEDIPTNEDASIIMRQVGDDRLASTTSILRSNTDVFAVKMWGFSATLKFADPIFIYTKALHALLNGDASTGVKGLRGHLHDRTGEGLPPPDIVLHFDGDPSAEKKDDKMCHSIFAPIVAKALRDALGMPVHLLILKLDNDPIPKMLGKFADYNESDGSWKVRSAFPSAGTPMAFYPGVDHSAFESCGVVVKHSDSTEKTEVKTSALLDSVMEGRVKTSTCLCVGGNTEASVEKMIKVGSTKFDLAVRIPIYALQPAPQPR